MSESASNVSQNDWEKFPTFSENPKWVAPLAMCTHSPCIKIDGTKETAANGVDIV